MLYQKVELKNGQVVITTSKEVDQSKLTSECWFIQFNGLTACESCEFLNTDECGGKRIRETLLRSRGEL